MRITVIGTGYVGLVVGVCFAEFGNEVKCLDIDSEKISKLQQGICTIYEPGVEDLLDRNIKANRLSFTTDKKEAIEFASIIFIAVGTPEKQNGEPDMSYVYESAADIANYMNDYKVIVDKSTVPVGTAKTITQIIEEKLALRNENIEFEVVSNPEFLREGKAVGDFINPDRIVIGLRSEKAKNHMLELYKIYKRSNKPIIITTPETAEMIKYASNSFLATKIAFINEIAELCEKVGANVLEVAAAMGKDGRISPKFLHPGPGYGGSCFPKDTKAIVELGKRHGASLSIIENVIKSNENQKFRSAQKIISKLKEGSIAILGLSFKPETDDIRESPAIEIIKILIDNGNYNLKLYDPKAIDEAKKVLTSSKIQWCESVYEAVKDSAAVAIITEWPEFRSMDLGRIAMLMDGKLFFDFRNIYTAEEVEPFGLKYYGTGV